MFPLEVRGEVNHKALSTLATIVADFGESPKTATIFSPNSATVTEIGDYSRQCGQGLKEH